MIRRHGLGWVGVVIVLLHAGCAAQQRAARLEAVQLQYRDAIRWGAFEIATTFVDDAIVPPGDLQRFKGLRVTGYEVLTHQTLDSMRGQRVKTMVKIDYYHQETPVVRSVTDVQEWQYRESDRRWLLRSGLPQFARTTVPSAQP